MDKYKTELQGEFKGDEIKQARLEKTTKEVMELKQLKEQLIMSSASSQQSSWFNMTRDQQNNY